MKLVIPVKRHYSSWVARIYQKCESFVSLMFMYIAEKNPTVGVLR